jgi:TolB-like protein/class 3 adenylate cyclase/predicted Zn-dependent protease
MPIEIKKEIELEIAHVLFIDIVGYSKLSVNEQHARIEELNEIVRLSEQFQNAEAANRILKIPTGDGMALVFYKSPEEPARCALEIAEALKKHPEIPVRMGIHSGPVSGVVDVNERTNVAGAGINIARRVMDCGDAGHILLSHHVAEDLAEYERWRPFLHDIGTFEVKHGVRVNVTNLYSDEVGNPQLPSKLRALRKHRARVRWAEAAAALLVLGAIVCGTFFYLRRPTASALRVLDKSIAVLPFENRSRDPDNAFFTDGVQDEILTDLAKIADLKVISRTSVLQYKSGVARNLREIAQQLGVANVVEGSVQRSGNRVRVNAQLVDARNDAHLWAQTYDRDLADVFAIQSEIAKAIADQLQAKLTSREEQALAVKPTNNPEAYDAYLTGLAFEGRYWSSFSFDLLRKAISFYERAVQLDPKFALAWARLSRADANQYFNRVDRATTARGDAAKRALENAQKLQPNSPETLLAQAYYQYWVLRDYELAKATFGRVRELLPGSSDVPAALALIARRQGHWDESVAYWEQALVLDPRNIGMLIDAAETYTNLRQFPAALKLCDRALNITPNDPIMMAEKAAIYQAEGNLQESARLMTGINEQTPTRFAFSTKIYQLRLERNYGEAIRLAQARLAQFRYADQLGKDDDQVTLALMQRLAGDTTAAKVTAEQPRNTLEPLFRDQPDKPYLAANLSQAYAVMGEKDLALKLAERAVMLLPSAKDAWGGPDCEENLAEIQAIFGENSRAIPTLSRLLQTPSSKITPALLRLDPIWDPLRSDPRFQKLCQGKQP